MPDVFFFGSGRADGNAEMADVLGGKGANLAEMTAIGVPVPPGFTVSTRVCSAFLRDHQLPSSLESEVRAAMQHLEHATARGFGDATNPLLVSIRSGAPVSMPGMMDTILNLGLNDDTVLGLAQRSGNAQFAPTIPIVASFKCMGPWCLDRTRLTRGPIRSKRCLIG